MARHHADLIVPPQAAADGAILRAITLRYVLRDPYRRSNAFTIAAVRRGSQLAGSTPIRRIRADFGIVRMLSVLMAESTLSPVSGPESMLTSVGMPRICDVMGAIVTQARRLTMC
jgi:hypothetical protein